MFCSTFLLFFFTSQTFVLYHGSIEDNEEKGKHRKKFQRVYLSQVQHRVDCKGRNHERQKNFVDLNYPTHVKIKYICNNDVVT